MSSSRYDEQRFIALFGRQVKAANAAAGMICLAIIASAALTGWRELGAALALHAVVFPMNLAISKHLVPRYGARAEYPRAILNSTVTGVCYGFLGWPTAVWLWLPFGAIVFDEFGGRHQTIVVALSWLIQGGCALAWGVDPRTVLAFGVLTVICLRLANARTEIIRDMLVEAERAIAQREATELELRQAQKLEAIGRLAAGVAHEINTPMQYIGDNLEFVSDGVGELLGDTAAPDEVDRTYLKEHLPRALADAAEGVRRVATIVGSLKRFAHPVRDRGPVDINAAIEATLVIARHEYRLVADVVTELGELPRVTCNGGELNQVLLNLVINAAHAIEDVLPARGRGTITIATARAADSVTIAIADTGGGVPEAVRDRIFEPFFTTKEVGRGTGQGLAIARSVMERHGGSLEFTTEVGVGTRFVVRLPVATGDIGPLAVAA